jgi:LCP family protein required for cell wall assembly
LDTNDGATNDAAANDAAANETPISDAPVNDAPTNDAPTNDAPTNDAPTADPGRSPSLAALLSFVWPGLGQLYLRNRRAAAIFVVPTLVVLAILLYALREGPAVFVARFADPNFALGALVIVLVLGVWRLAAVIHGFVACESRRSYRIIDKAAIVALVIIITVTHLTAGYILGISYNAENDAFNPHNDLSNQLGFNDSPSPGTVASDSPSPSDVPGDSPTPTATPAGPNQRVTMLFLGVDDSTGTKQCDRPVTSSYNAIMVVSYDPKTNSIAMVSVPREWAGFPMYYPNVSDGIGVTYEIAYLPNNVRSGRYPSPDSPPLTLIKEVQYLVGIKIDYYAVMITAGFMKTIDAVGGIDIVNPGAINDPYYDNLNCGPSGFKLAAGPQHLTGAQAFAYVASRRGTVGTSYNNDYSRISRQQQVMLALLHKMASPDEVLQIPGLIQTVGSSIVTGSLDPSNPFEPSMIADYVNIADSVPSGNITQVILQPKQPGTYAIQNIPGWGASICPFMPNIAKESIAVFGHDSRYYGKALPANFCPV